jgi:hypothetical protein
MIVWDNIYFFENQSPKDLIEDKEQLNQILLIKNQLDSTDLEGVITDINHVLQSNKIEDEEFFKNNFMKNDLYAGPFLNNNNLYVFWFNHELSRILVIKEINNENVDWLLSAFSYLIEFNFNITKEKLLETRYKFPIISTYSDKSNELSSQDLFQTYPNTYFQLIIKNATLALKNSETRKPYDSINEIIELENNLLKLVKEISKTEPLKTILDLLKTNFTFQEIESYEKSLIQINLLEALISLEFQPEEKKLIHNHFIQLFTKLQQVNMQNLAWIIGVLINYYFEGSLELEAKDLDENEIPPKLLFLPKIKEIRENQQYSKDERLKHYLKLNNQSVGIPMFLGQEDLYSSIADLSYEINDYQNAALFYSLLVQSYKVNNKSDLLSESLKKEINSEFDHFKEYSSAANLYHFLGQRSEAAKLAWRVLVLSMNIVRKLLGQEESFVKLIIDEILELIPQCKRPLLAEENEMTPVVELKIDELINFYKEIRSDFDESNVNNLMEIIDMHSDSIKFLMPYQPTLFLLLSNDGRLMYSVKATSDLSTEENQISHLMAGVLTAVRSIFLEASFSGGGTLKEINTGDSTLLIEGRDSLVFVASAVNMTQGIKIFTAKVADYLNNNYTKTLSNWGGGLAEIDDIITYINNRILEELVT